METYLDKVQAWFDIWALRGSKKETKYEPLIVVKISLKMLTFFTCITNPTYVG